MAADEEIGARLSLKDRRQFSSEVDHARRDVRDLGDEAKKTDRKARTAAGGFGVMGTAVKKMGKIVAVGLVGITAALGGLVVMAGKGYLEAQKVGAQTQAVIKSTGGAAGLSAQQIGDLASTTSRKAAADDEAVQSGLNLLLTFTQVKNGVGEGNDIFDRSAMAMADMSQALGKDLPSSAMQ